MNKKNLKLFGVAVALYCLSGCVPAYNAFQVVELERETDVKLATLQDSLTVSNPNIKVGLDFWSDNGLYIIRIENTSDKVLSVDFSRSHIVLNGKSYDYFNENEVSTGDVVTNSQTRYDPFFETSSTYSQATINTVTRKRTKIRQIPAKSYIEEYCAVPLAILPFSNYMMEVFDAGIVIENFFSKSNTPCAYKNIICYSIDDDTFTNPQYIENSFYVSVIRNMVKKHFRGKAKVNPRTEKKTFPYPYTQKNRYFRKYKIGSK